MTLHITRASGALRAAGVRYLEREHYMQSSGGSGALYVVVGPDGDVQGATLIGATASANCDRSILGACLVGPAASQDAERSLAGPNVTIRQIKRSHLRDEVPPTAMCESKLLRHAMRDVCDTLGQPVLFVSYADPAATDSRTGMPLAGWCYLAAGFFYAGETTSQRWCVIDHQGRARSTRQGAVTLRRAMLPKVGEVFHGQEITADWQMVKLPPARVWLALQLPSGGFWRRKRRRVWQTVWSQLNPSRRVAAKQWLTHAAWQEAQAQGIVSLSDPDASRGQHRLVTRMQPALWPGADLAPDAAPVWVPLAWQHRLLAMTDVEGETIAGRTYAPLAPRAESVCV